MGILDTEVMGGAGLHMTYSWFSQNDYFEDEEIDAELLELQADLVLAYRYTCMEGVGAVPGYDGEPLNEEQLDHFAWMLDQMNGCSNVIVSFTRPLEDSVE